MERVKPSRGGKIYGIVAAVLAAVVSGAFAMWVATVDSAAGFDAGVFAGLWGTTFLALAGLLLLPLRIYRYGRESVDSVRRLTTFTSAAPNSGGPVSRWGRAQLSPADLRIRPSAPAGEVTRGGSGSRIRTFAVITLLGAAAVCLGLGLWAVGAGNAVLAALMFALAPVWVLSLVGWLPPRILRGRVSTGPDGLTLRSSRWLDAVVALILLDGIVALGLWGMLGYAGRVGEPAVFADAPILYPVVFGGLAAFLGVLLAVYLRRGGATQLQLDAYGFRILNGLGSTHGAWSEIVAITDDDPTGTITPGAITLVNAGGYTATLSRPDFLVPDTDALRALIWFYWQNPQYRIELTDGRAANRLLGSGPAVCTVGRT